MNIFWLSDSVTECAEMHCDKHAGGKMLLESAQMLSTAHRLLDGTSTPVPNTKKVKYVLSDERETALYKTVHQNHPCTKWAMASFQNYMWLYALFGALCDEYTYRYGKTHKSSMLLESLRKIPDNIPRLNQITEPALAMKSNPECVFPGDAVKSYRAYYQTKQTKFKMAWKKRNPPEWFTFI